MTAKEASKILLTTDKIIDRIRTVRNDEIKTLIAGAKLDELFQEKHGKSITAVKKQFLVKDLKERLIAPIDLTHYAGLINLVRERQMIDLIGPGNAYIADEIASVMAKYSF